MELNPAQTPNPAGGEILLTCSQRAVASSLPLQPNATLAWNEARAIRIRGPIDRPALFSALQRLVDRHDALRMRIRGDQMQAGVPDASAVRRIDLAPMPSVQQGEALHALLHALVVEPLSLPQGPLFKAVLVDLGPVDLVIGMVAHHTVCDGWSFGILIEELVALYNAAMQGGAMESALGAAPSFLQFARNEIAGAAADQRHTDLAYWESVYADAWPTLDLPTDHARGALRTFTSQRQELRLDPGLITRLKTTAGRQGASLFSILCAGYAALVARLSGSSEVVVAVPAAAQLTEGLDRLVGQCVSHLPLRLAVDVDAPAGQLLATTQHAVLDAYEHMSCGLELLLERHNPSAEQGRLPLACVKFNLNPSLDVATAALPDVQCDVWTPARVAEHFELFLNAEQDAQGVLLCCQHNSDLFDAATVRRWLGLYEQILAGMANDLDQPLATLLTPIGEDHALLTQFNANTAALDRALRVEAMIDAQVQRTPQAIAVTAGEETLTFLELQRRAYGVAAELQRRGVQAGDLVGLSCGRNQLMMVGVYGILKAGAGYVPLDPSFPVDRLDFMSQDAALQLVLCDESVADGWKPSGAEVLMLDHVSTVAEAPMVGGAHSEMPAYVIYTSGSTGKPKGVRVPHRSVVNLLQSVAQEPGMGPTDTVLAVTTLSFDIAVSEVILPMTVGARIVVANREETTDGTALRALIERQHVDFVDATPSTWRLLLAAGWPGHDGMKAICTGEPLPPDLAIELIPRVAELWNGYGPTETTVWSSFHRVTSPSVPIPIGRPVQNTQFHVLDAGMRLLPVGVTGELWIGGDGVTLGYLNRPDLTAERFVPDPFSTAPGASLYKTGDLGRWRADGVLECLGRADHQVKVRGYRIELGEIEVQLCAHPAVSRAVVITREDRPGDVRLVAYVVPHQTMPSVSSMREHLSVHLPEYMVPQHFVPMAQIPLLPNGKINRHALLPPSGARPELSVPYQTPVNALEAGCCEVFGNVLNIDQVGRHDNFFDLGGNSLLAMRVLEGLTKLTGKTLSAPTIFAYPNPASLAEYLAPQQTGADMPAASPKRARRAYHDDDPIAIVGMAGRFPGAATVEALWENLIAGRDAITQFTLDTLDPSIPLALRNDPNYVKARGVVDGVEMFDNGFFGISAREAEVMDPQHRVFLEIAWECLERAGYAPDRIEQAVGVFAGVYTPTYLHRHVLAHPEAIERIGEFQVMVGNDKDYVATRVAHKLNLKGPAIAIHTACSTSLVAISQAVDSLRLGRCDMALAGAASVTSPPRSGYLYQEGAMLSKDGHTRTFDADASGTAFNDGAAVVLLKRLSDAQADGDHVFALIRGIATNNDGGGKASFTAPSVQGQAAVIAAAHEDAGIDPRSISYVEAHGTATPLGDPVEVEGLTRAFQRRTQDTGFCRIGSVKSNVGHLVTAAGATGLIKTALALSTEQLPATIHFGRLNPNIDFANSPFVVNSELTPWPRGHQPRRAGVSSFGVGGTNAHAVLEEAPMAQPSTEVDGPHLLRLSAKTRSALDTMATQLAEHLTQHPDLNLADVAHTLRVGRSRFAHRLTVVGASAAECADALRTTDHAQRAVREVGAAVPPLVWLFPGQGAQYAGMGRELYAHDEAFRAAFDECLQALQDVLPFDLKARMFDGGPEALVATDTTQPATFVLEYALARSWLAQGARPAALIGHSVGEFAAAVLAGVMPLADAARLVARRGALMQTLPGGSMLSVRLSLDKLMPLLPPELSLAAENGPSACVVAGPTPAVQAWQAQLEADGVVARLLQTSHAFHSSMMEPAVAPFEEEVRQVRLSAPQIPIFSTLTGTTLQASEATDPHYWARHLREPVRFSPALKSALATGEVAFLEIGPRGTLSTLARQHGAGKRAAVCVPSLGDAPESETALLALARGQLWTLGLELPAPAGTQAQGRRRVRLPTYPFERKRFWLEAVDATPLAPVALAAPISAPVTALPEAHATAAAPSMSNTTMSTASPSPAPSNPASSRPALLAARLRALFEDVAGVDIDSADSATGFLELGLDSLSLTQAALQVKKTFNVSLTFRQLMEKYRSVDALAQFLDAELPPDQFAPPVDPASAAAPVTHAVAMPVAASVGVATYVAPAAMPVAMPMALLPGDASAVHQLMQQQMQLMAQQLAVLAGQPLQATQPAQFVATAPAAAPVVVTPLAATAAPAPVAPASSADPAQPSLKSLVEKPFGASPRLTLQAQQDFTPEQRRWLDDFIARSNARSAKSKAFSQQNRKVMADPRVVTGFNPLWKDLVYPLVVNRSSGASMWDLDGNEYIDLLSCFGGNLLGYQPPGVAQALHQQVDQGFEVGPQHPLAADVARLMTEFTGMERVGFCNTGSEAVMGAMRIARTVTGRKTIAIFSNSYHGIFDEVVVRGTKQLRSVSAAPGILANTVENILVLDWNSEDSLRILRERGQDLAAIMTEPIQNKYPTIQPREFVQSLRQIADKAGCALIFDEVVTGFRVAPGGAQEFYGVRADIATYGKVIGGGLPFAAIAGNANWLDALDGGHWQYGDDSYPEAGVTYFAGTFVRQPLALAAAHATLLHIKQGGRAFYRDLNDRTQRLIDRLNTAFAVRGAPVKAVHCASIWRLQWDDNQKYISLFYHLARFQGLHLYEQFGHFVTAGMTDEHTDRIFRVFTDAIDELMGLGFILPKDGTPPPKGGIETGPASRTDAQITPGQNERWLAGGFDPSARRALNESLCVSLKGAVDRGALKQALQDVLTRHDTFRVHFSLDEPRQMLAPATPISVAEVDLRQQADADKALDDFCSQASLREFPLDQAPLAAVSLLDLSDGRVVVHVVACHLVFDGWASSVFNAELATAYKARSMGMPPPFKPAESPLDFAEEEQARFEGPDGQEALRFWQQQLHNPPAPLNLGDRTPGTPRSFAADTCSMRIDGEAFGRLRTQARQSGATLFQVLLTAVTLMLRKRSGQSDFVVCIPYASQSLQQHGPLMADGVLDLPLRLSCADGESNDAVLQRVRSHLMDALEHPLITQGTVARALGIRSSGDRPALTGVYFNLNPKVDLSAYAPLQATMHEGRKRGLLSQLFFNFYEQDDALTLDLHHSSEYFSPQRARELVDALKAQINEMASPHGVQLPVLTAVVAPAAVPARQSPTVDPRLIAWNRATTQALEPHARVEQWISRQAAATPDAVALVAHGVSLSYAALESRANRFGQLLRSRGIGAGMLVGVCLTRGPNLVPALLGILKTGAAYVPLDPGFPKDRLHYMAEDAGVRLVITDATNAPLSGVPREQQIRIDDDAAAIAAAPDSALPHQADWKDDAPMYVIYTSGSTGKPKGVVLPQKAVCNFLASMRREPGLQAGDRLLAVTTLSFDIAVLELFLPLTTGASVVLAQREDAMDGEVLARLAAEQRINVMQATPTTWHMLLDAGWRAPTGFRALCGGEPLPPSLAERLLDAGVELWNMYGPTETTVWSTLCRITDAKQKITIGHPIDNTQVWVLDEQMKPCAIGQEGELCIGGAGVATGYFKRPELTAEKFVADPFDPTPGARIYRTGDLARWREDGTLEHLGRLDFQVKIRGYRIELGEIEARLAALPGIARTVVMAREDSPGDVRLIGYAVPHAGQQPDPTALREALRVGLPDYMLPQQIVLLDTMPLLPNGKIDRKALPAPTGPAPAATTGPLKAARNATEKAVVDAMQTVLKLPSIGIDEDFFALGGHSLLAAKVIGQLNKTQGLQLNLRMLFESPSAEKLALRIDEQRGGNAPQRDPVVRRAQQHQAPLTLMQERIRFIEEMQPDRVVYNVPSAHRLRGPMQLEAFDRAFGEVIRRQHALRTSITRVGNTFVQTVADEVPFTLLPLEDLSTLPAARRDGALEERMQELVSQPFSLDRAPLFKARLFRLEADHHVLFFMTHHAIWDGWSFDLLYEEMNAHYQAFREGKATPLAALPLSYGDFAEWHGKWLDSEELRQQLAFWKNQFQKHPVKTPRADLARQSGAPRVGAIEFKKVSAAEADHVRDVAKRTGSTLSIVALSVYTVILSQLLREPTPTIGLPVRGRPLPDLEPIMGFFNNMLPVRLPVDTSLTWVEWIARVRATVVAAFTNQDIPFERIASALEAEQPGMHGSLYQAMFTFQDARNRPTKWGNLDHERVLMHHKGSTEDLNLGLVEIPSGIEVGVQYDTSVYLPSTAQAVRDRFLSMLAAVATNPTQTVAQLMAPDALALRALHALDAPAVSTDDLLETLGRTAQQHGATVIVRTASGQVDLKEFERRVVATSEALKLPATDSPATVIVALADPVAQLVASLAVMRSGHACLSVDADSVPALLAAGTPATRWLLVDALPIGDLPAQVLRIDAAAVSGYSAPPSASHQVQPAVALAPAASLPVDCGQWSLTSAALATHAKLLKGDQILALSPAPASHLALLGLALRTGAELVFTAQATLANGDELVRRMTADRVGLVHAEAAVWGRVFDARRGATLPVIATLEVQESSSELVSALLDAGASVLSLYQPGAGALPIAAGWVTSASEFNLFGRPLVTQTLQVAECAGEPLAIGMSAALWARTPHTASWTDLGSLVRWRSDGQLQYLGETRPEALLAGQRISFDALDRVAAGLPGVASAATRLHSDAQGRRRLVVGLQPSGETPIDNDRAIVSLRAALPLDARGALEVRWFERIARTPDGRLHLSQSTQLRPHQATTPPQVSGKNTAEEIQAVWSELLGITNIRPHDNFFDLGGTSLTAMQAVQKLEQRIGKQISPRRYVSETLAQLAAAYDGGDTEASIAAVQEKPAPTPSLMKRLVRLVQRA